MIRVLQAYTGGEATIQYLDSNDRWRDCENPDWDEDPKWDFKKWTYRVKPSTEDFVNSIMSETADNLDYAYGHESACERILEFIKENK